MTSLAHRPNLQQAPMVSQPTDVLDRAVSVRPPTSVSSRHSTSRRHHRHGHSHHGASAHQPLNEFPIFAHTGDVEIVIKSGGQEKRYLLHRLILSQCSGFFEASTSEEWSRSQVQREIQAAAGPATGSAPDRALSIIREDDSSGTDSTSVMSGPLGRVQPVKMRWRYELDWEDKEEEEEPILVQKPPSSNTTLFGGDFAPQPVPSRTKPAAPQQGFFRSMANLSSMQSAVQLSSAAAVHEPPMDPLVRDYDNLFRIFYNYPPTLNSVNIASAYAECKALLSLADMYDALPVTGPRVDHHLLRFSSRLFKQIAKYPPSYLKLGYLARSRVIFSEALIHVVGQWPAALPHLRNSSYSPVPDVVLDLIEDKFDDLEDAKARVEAKLFRLTLTTSRGERVNPSNAYLDWLAVSLFRQWLVENTTPPPPPILKNTGSANGNHGTANGANRASIQSQSHATAISTSKPSPIPPPFSSGRAYRLIGSSSSQAYLPHEELKRFLKLHPTPGCDAVYSRESMKRFERKVDEIKRLAKEIAKPLMRNFLELDLKGPEGEGIGGSGLPYLTCTKIEEEDFPWD